MRIGVVVSKKVAKHAVVRNRIRRRVFEQIRLHMDDIDDGFEGVFGVYEASVADMPARDLKKHIQTLIKSSKSDSLQKSE